MTYKNKFITYSTALSTAITLALAGPAYSAEEDGDTALEEVLITGTRIRGGRQVPSIPIDVVSSDEIKLSGYVNVEQVLNNMPQFVPSRTASTNSTANPTATGAATLDLRGLGAQRTLVLVNGRRYMFFDSSQTTDINTIPASLIERVEVVTGGASAVYGSDAIAGVVNFILKDDFEGVELQAQINKTSEGDGDIVDFSVTMGGDFADNKGNAVVAFNYLNRDGIMTTDRDFSASVLTDGTDSNGNRVLVPGGSSFIPNGRIQGIPSNPDAIAAIPGLAAAMAAAGLAGISNNGFRPDDSGMSQRPYNAQTDRFNYTLDNFLRIPQERFSLTALSHLEINENTTAYFEGSYSHNETTTGFASSFMNQSFPVEVDNPYIGPELSDVLRLLDSDENGLVNLGINRRLLELGPRRNEDTRNAFRVLFGIKGSFGENNYDTYFSYSRSDNTQIQTGNASRNAFAEGILSGSGGANGAPILNPFGPNLSAEGVEFLNIATTNTEATEMKVFGATLDRTLFEMPAGPVAGLIGTEWRSSSVDFRPDQSLLTGDVAGFNAITAARGEIDVWELFMELSMPLLADKPGFESLNATAAYRYSDYDLKQTGGVSSYLLGLDWQVNSSLAFGAQYQRAIRAPSVGEAFGGQRLFPVGATDPCAIPGAEADPTLNALCVDSGVPAELVGDSSIQPNNEIPGLFGGNPNLSEEESDTYTLSAIFTPEAIPALRISLDYFNIDVADAIGVFGGSVNNVLSLCYEQIQELSSEACQAVGRNTATGVIDSLNPVQVTNVNVGALETSGFDLGINYSHEFGFGFFDQGSDLSINFTATFLDEFNLTPIADLETVNECAGAFGRTCGEPKSEIKTNTTFVWTNGDLMLSLRHRWLDGTTLDEVAFGQRTAAQVAVPKLDSVSYVDLSANYTFNESFSLWGGIINLLDEDPPLLGSRQTRANTIPDTFSPTGMEFFLGGSFRF